MCCKTKQKNYKLKCLTIKTYINSWNFFSESFLGAEWHTSDIVWLRQKYKYHSQVWAVTKGFLDSASCYPRWRAGLVVNQGKHTYTPTIPISLLFISLFSGLQESYAPVVKSPAVKSSMWLVRQILWLSTWRQFETTAGFFTFEISMFDEKIRTI